MTATKLVRDRAALASNSIRLDDIKTVVNAEQSLKKSITVNVGAGETKAAFAKLRD